MTIFYCVINSSVDSLKSFKLKLIIIQCFYILILKSRPRKLFLISVRSLYS